MATLNLHYSSSLNLSGWESLENLPFPLVEQPHTRLPVVRQEPSSRSNTANDGHPELAALVCLCCRSAPFEYKTKGAFLDVPYIHATEICFSEPSSGTPYLFSPRSDHRDLFLPDLWPFFQEGVNDLEDTGDLALVEPGLESSKRNTA